MVALSAFSATGQAETVALNNQLITASEADRGLSATDVDLRAYTGFARSIERSDFAHRFVETSTLLDSLPGVQVRRTGGVGSHGEVSLRASTGRQVNVFLDGLLLNSPSSGAATINQLPMVLVDRITVYPDVTPVELGNANLAGAVDFVTRAMPDDAWGGELRGSLGSFGTRNAEAASWGRLGDWELVGALSHTRADNDFPVASDLFATTSRRRRNDGYARDGVFLKAARRGEHLQTRALLQYGDADKELPTTRNRRADDASLRTESLRLQSVVDYRLAGVDIGHRFFFSRDDERFADPEGSIGLEAERIDSDQRAFGLFTAVKRALGDHRLTLGLDLRRDDFTQDDRIDDARIVDAYRNTVIASLGEAWAPAPGWLLRATARLHHVDDGLRELRRNVAASDGATEPSAQLGLSWRSGAWSWKANAAWQLRVPTLNEKFGARGLFQGAPDLEHERGLAFDTGFTFDAGTLSASTSLFFRRVSDTIVTVFNSRGIGQAQNVGDSLRGGIESDLHWRPLPWLDFRLDATLLDSKNRSRIASARGQRLPGIYHRSYGAGVAVSYRVAVLSVDYRQQEALFYDSANAVRADDKKELSTALTLKWRGYSLDLRVDNWLDRNFLDLNRFPTPGRSYRATVSATFL